MFTVDLRVRWYRQVAPLPLAWVVTSNITGATAYSSLLSLETAVQTVLAAAKTLLLGQGIPSGTPMTVTIDEVRPDAL